MIDERVLNALLLTGLGAAGTALGGLIVVLQPKMQFKRLGYLQGLAAGLMLCISMLDLMPAAVEEVGFAAANGWFFAGVAFFAAVVHFIPEPSSEGLQLDDEEDKAAAAAAGRKAADSAGTAAATSKKKDDGPRRVLLSGLITAIGIALHNFPEGVAVFLASMKSHAVGASLAFAIALHNVPEGVAVALPVYFATGSRTRGFLYAATSGLAEPLAVVVLAVFFPTNLDRQLVEKLLAAVGGIMAFLSISELLPLAFEHAGRQRAVISLFLGMAIMSANLYILDHWLGHDH
ncbi:hypothetical protein VOLCADRAFT_66570 [Volvox carteri f. nagariensis]|uniref:Uncharacterized protein n=1 Tax=Volvox carteri f. nagariensis TaxID=3068 RepID=D8UBQ7_VOLCA|nr:uncharacterized protein VOLCADRAFT_66570 [Volvox carteri f. nagariensis]EFJ42807.1 hypothetical protein VOLCADRAFT_66570 [Volvox carteri f. nagariensis]|eukprot:XP_002956067.1 hypothetical protein VOLCADRAFT_66570 [Volvox carteri f. nagariensis]